MATQAQLLKKELAAAFPGIKFSVRSDRGYAIRVEYTDGPGLKAVNAIAKRYESIHRCEYSGEILSGCNTFVSVTRNLSVELRAEFERMMGLEGYTSDDRNTHWYQQDWTILVMGDSSPIDPAAMMEERLAAAAVETWEEEEVITIEPVQIHIQPFFITGVQFANLNKNNTIAEYQAECDKGDYATEETRIEEVWQLTADHYDYLCQNLLGCESAIDIWSDKGGASSHNIDQLPEPNECYSNWTKADWTIFHAGRYRIAIAVAAPNRPTIAIDPSGHSYSRYVGLLSDQDVFAWRLEEHAIDPAQLRSLPQVV